MTDERACIGAGDLDAPLAAPRRRDDRRGASTSPTRAALAERLPAAGAMLNLSADRYRFAVGLGAALLRGHTSLLPPNHIADTVARLRARFAGVYALVEATADGHGLPTRAPRRRRARRAGARRRRSRRSTADLVAAYVLTSGSTGEPVPHAKPWGLLVAQRRAPRRAGSPPRSAAPTSPASRSSRRCRRSTCTASSRAC